MTGWLTAGVAGIVRAWTWLYTFPVDAATRHDRRREIESDLWEFRADPERGASLASAGHLLARAALGMADDLLWTGEQLSTDIDPPRLSTIIRFAMGIAAAATVAVSATGPTLDVARALRVNVDATGWLADTAADTTSTEVPVFVFTLTNVSDQPTAALQVNAIFNRRNANDVRFGTAFAPVVGWRGLAPGVTSQRVMLRGQGWRMATGGPTVHAVLPRRTPAEAGVKLFVQHEGRWTLLGDFAIPARRLQP